jgi:hypothetical protein
MCISPESGLWFGQPAKTACPITFVTKMVFLGEPHEKLLAPVVVFLVKKLILDQIWISMLHVTILPLRSFSISQLL